MAFIPLQGFKSNLSTILANSATQMALPAAAVNYVASQLLGGHFTILTLNNNVNFEIVKVTGASAGLLTIERAQEGTLAYTYGVGTPVVFQFTTIGIQDVAVGSTPTTLMGLHAAHVTGGPDYTIDVPIPTFIPSTGMNITGTWPGPYTFVNTAPGTPGPSTIVTGSGIANVTPISGGYNVSVPAYAFSAGSGISLSGTYPGTITITNTAPASGSGTVTNVTASDGLAVTGSSTTTPNIIMANSGVTEGNYGGITVNARGQVTDISSSLITSITPISSALLVGTPVIGEITLDLKDATIAQKGIVQLASATSSASNNPADSTSAVTPAGINAVVATLGSTQVSGFGAQTPLLAANYTTAVSGFTTTLNVTSGKKALVDVYVEVMDTMIPTNMPSFAMGLFNGATLLEGDSVIPGALRKLSCVITGPFSSTLSVKTTTLGTNEVVSSYYGTVIAI